MSVAQFEALCDAGKISATLEAFVLEMTAADRQTLEREQPEEFAQHVRDLHFIGFDLDDLESAHIIQLDWPMVRGVVPLSVNTPDGVDRRNRTHANTLTTT
jgi:hypothetical protein